VASSLPATVTNKVLKRRLRAERWDCDDPVWWRPPREAAYRPLTAEDRAGLTGRFMARGLGHVPERA
jgi:fatty-acyl-CoA synthase